VVAAGRPGRRHDLLPGGVPPAVGDVLRDGALKEPGVLEHHADAPPQLPPGQGGDVLPVYGDGAAVQLVEAHQQVDQGGLAAAGGAHDGHHLVGAHLQVQVVDQGALRCVAEAHMAKLHVALRDHGGIPRRIGPLLLLVQQGEHPLGPRDGGLEGGDDIGGLGHRLGDLVDILQKGLHSAQGDSPAQGHAAAQDGGGDEAKLSQHADGGVDGVVGELGPALGAELGLVEGLRLLQHGRLPVEHLDHPVARVQLLHLAGQRPHGRHIAAVGPLGQGGDVAGGRHAEGQGDQHHQKEPGTEHHHGRRSQSNGKHR